MVLLAGAMLFSCKEKGPDTPGQPDPDPVYPSETKVSLPAGGPLSVYNWQAADKIRVGDSVFSLKSGAGSKTGTFQGEAVADSYFTITYPAAISSIDSYLSRSFSGQVQDSNGSTAHLPNTVFIEDVTTYTDVTLGKEWVESKGGTIRSNGVVAFDLAFPAGAGAIESIMLESAGIRFPVDNAGEAMADNLTLTLNNVNAASGPVKAWMAVAEKSVVIPEGSQLKVTVTGETSYTVMLPGPIEIGGGILTEIKVSDASAWEEISVVRGSGTEESPFILKTAEDVAHMGELMESGKTVWFELGADIDMSSIVNWTPLNLANPYDKAVHFDGKDHIISNFNVADKGYTSFFGVLNGVCQNVKFKDCTSKHTLAESAGAIGIVAGYAGANNDLARATVINVTASNCTVSTSAAPESYFPVGGLFGAMVSTTAENCSFDGTVMNEALATGSNGNRCSTGGIAGRVNAGCSLVGCSVSGTVTSTKCRYTGGIVGWVSPSEDINIIRCGNSAKVTGGLDRAGGIVGHYQQGTMESCMNYGEISCGLVGTESGAGGLVGYSGPVTIKKGINGGAVSGTGRYVGGIFGCAEMMSTVEICYSNAEVTAGGRYVGGIVGGMKSADGGAIRNCFSSGKVTSTGDQEAGGIVGSIMQKTTVSCCFSSAEVAARRVAGGIVGRACNGAWTYTGQYGNTVEKCIAWNPSVKATTTGDVNSTGGSGIIVGFTSFYNTLSACWRNPDLVFEASDTAANVACDQPDCSPSSPFVMGTTPGTAGKYGCPYHGKTAAAGKTPSSIASDLGWSSDFWDLSTSTPTPKVI